MHATIGLFSFLNIRQKLLYYVTRLMENAATNYFPASILPSFARVTLLT